jgi:hypothetical protein
MWGVSGRETSCSRCVRGRVIAPERVGGLVIMFAAEYSAQTLTERNSVRCEGMPNGKALPVTLHAC